MERKFKIEKKDYLQKVFQLINSNIDYESKKEKLVFLVRYLNNHNKGNYLIHSQSRKREIQIFDYLFKTGLKGNEIVSQKNSIINWQQERDVNSIQDIVFMLGYNFEEGPLYKIIEQIAVLDPRLFYFEVTESITQKFQQALLFTLNFYHNLQQFDFICLKPLDERHFLQLSQRISGFTKLKILKLDYPHDVKQNGLIALSDALLSLQYLEILQIRIDVNDGFDQFLDAVKKISQTLKIFDFNIFGQQRKQKNSMILEMLQNLELLTILEINSAIIWGEFKMFESISRLPRIQQLIIDDSYSNLFNKNNFLKLSLMKDLKGLKMQFGFNNRIRNTDIFKELFEGIISLLQLESLILNLDTVYSIYNEIKASFLKQFLQGIQNLVNLKQLEIKLPDYNRIDSDIIVENHDSISEFSDLTKLQFQQLEYFQGIVRFSDRNLFKHYRSLLFSMIRLEYLSVELSKKSVAFFDDFDLIMGWFSQLRLLQYVKLSVQDNLLENKQAIMLGNALQQLEKLEQLKLNLNQSYIQTSGLAQILNSLLQLELLSKFFFQMQNFQGENDDIKYCYLKPFSFYVPKFKSLKQLKFEFDSSCLRNFGAIAMKNFFKQLVNLEKLKFQFNSEYTGNEIIKIFQGIQLLHNLVSLNANIYCNSSQLQQMHNFKFAQLLQQFETLNVLNLELWDLEQYGQEQKEISKAVSMLQNLRKVKIQYRNQYGSKCDIKLKKEFTNKQIQFKLQDQQILIRYLNSWSLGNFSKSICRSPRKQISQKFQI